MSFYFKKGLIFFKTLFLAVKILIVKTSSLGDVIQSLVVLNYLKQTFPHCKIDWIVKKKITSFLKAHPLVDKVIELSFSNLLKMRKKTYDYVFDLQGNTKSGFVTFICKGKEKIGYNKKSVREWPNILATKQRYFISKKQKIGDFYLGLIKTHFQDFNPFVKKSPLVKRSISKNLLEKIDPKQINIMVCPGSKWENKKVSAEALISFLQKLQKKYSCHFFLSSGSDLETKENEKISKELIQKATLLDQISIFDWQSFMSMMDIVIAMDSSSLHLCATVDIPSFSIFGPTSSLVFNPKGEKHYAIQGKCPYGQVFIKQCPKLRSCSTGACIKNLSGDDLFYSFTKWEEEQGILKKRS